MTNDPAHSLTAALADRYRIESELGAGGMATVYLAEDLKHHRKVAIKVLHTDLSAMLGPERFLKEIELTASLQHPVILPLFDSGNADGLLYYVMPYVEGETLRARLDRERQLPVEDAIRIASDIADALEYAHKHGVIHRDIKPENILLQDGRPVVADFGIALAVQQATSGAQRMTQTGVSLGTPQYMSPEQAMGEQALDARTDIYALGAVTYEMLAGEPPFVAPTAQATVARVMTDTPRSLHAQRHTVPVAVDAAVLRALEKLPADRFSSAHAFSHALAAGATDAPVSPSADGRRKSFAVVGIVVIAAIALGAGIALARRSSKATAGAGKAGGAQIVAVLPFHSIASDSTQRYFGDGMTAEISGQLSKLAALRVVSQAASAPYENVSDRLGRMRHELGVGSVVDGTVRVAGNRIRIDVELMDATNGQTLWSDQYDRDLTDIFAVQSDVAHRIAAALQAKLTPSEARRVDRAPTANVDAYRIYLQAQATPVVNGAGAQAAITRMHDAIALDTTFALAYAELAREFMFMAAYTGPAYLDSASVAARTALRLQPDLAYASFVLGDLQASQGHLADARLSYLRSLELDQSLVPAMEDLSEAETTLGHYDQALYWALRAQPLDPNEFHVYYHTGVPLLRLADDHATQELLDSAVRRFADGPGGPRLQSALAALDFLRGRDSEAMARARHTAASYPHDDEAASFMAQLAALTGAPDADALLSRRLLTNPESGVDLAPARFPAWHALFADRRGDHAAATRMWDDVLASDARAIASGNDDPQRPMEIAAIHAVRGDSAAALEWLQRGYNAGWKNYRVIMRDPFFASLTHNPRFQQIMTSMRTDTDAMRKRAMTAENSLVRWSK
jgi:eukaryotic-like serine/threonine-protein kinase